MSANSFAIALSCAAALALPAMAQHAKPAMGMMPAMT